MAEALAWLWRLGPVADSPGPGAVVLGDAGDLAELRGAVREGRARAAIVIAPGEGPEAGGLPARRMVEGVARFARGARVFDRHTVFASGSAVMQSRVGRHAVLVDERVLAVGADLAERWGRLGAYWALAPIEELFAEVLDRPLVKLAPVGALRLDDAPSTAQMQLEGREKSDPVGLGRAQKLRRTYGRAGARLSIAVAARGLEDGKPVPAEQVWPRSIQELGRGCAEGTFEPIAHGWLHYDPELTTPEKVEPREFAQLDEAAAGERIDAVLAWQREHLGDPKTFVAPAWGYSEGTLRALAARGLPAWHRAAAEPLLVNGNPRETLIGPGGIGGVFRLDYGSLVRLANAGVPPTLALHGGLMDDRLESRILRDAFGYARLFMKRDAHRLPRIKGIRWIGAAELVERYRAHEATEVVDGEPRLPAGAEVIVRDRNGQRAVRG